MTARAFLLAALVLTVAAAAGSCGAARHFHGRQVGRVGCDVRREFRRRGSLIRAWGCWRVAGGILTHDLACVRCSV